MVSTRDRSILDKVPELLEKAIVKSVIAEMGTGPYDMLRKTRFSTGSVLIGQRQAVSRENSTIIGQDEDQEWERRQFLISLIQSDKIEFLRTMITLGKVIADDFQHELFMAQFFAEIIGELRNEATTNSPLSIIFNNQFPTGNSNSTNFSIFKDFGRRLTKIINLFWTDNIFVQTYFGAEMHYDENRFNTGINEFKEMLDRRREENRPEIMRDFFLLLLALGKLNVAHCIWLLGRDQLSSALVASALLRKLARKCNKSDHIGWGHLFQQSSK